MVYGIRVAKKSVLYSPSPYTVSGGPSLRFRDCYFSQFVAQEGTALYSFPTEASFPPVVPN